MTCLMAPLGPRLQALATVPESDPASGVPEAASQSMTTEVVAAEALQEPPSGTGPSPTLTVTVTGPGVVQVKFVAEDVGAEKVPLGADQENERRDRSLPVPLAV